MIEELKINGELVFEIRSMNHWIKAFPGAIPELPMSEQYLWIDKNGNIATCGEDFMFAEDTNCYPIKVFHIQRTSHLNPKNEKYVQKLKQYLEL